MIEIPTYNVDSFISPAILVHIIVCENHQNLKNIIVLSLDDLTSYKQLLSLISPATLVHIIVSENHQNLKNIIVLDPDDSTSYKQLFFPANGD